jgi:replicative DNA helicase
MAQNLIVVPGGLGTTGRPAPCDLDAEKASLGCVLIKPTAFDELLGVVHTDDFYLPAHREIFEAMLELYKRRLPFDPIAIADELKGRGALSRLEGGEAYLTEIASSVPTAENMATYVRIVRKKAAHRRLLHLLAEMQSSANGDIESVPDLVDEIRARVDHLSSSLDTHEPVKVGDGIGATLEAIEKRGQSPEETPVQFGLREVDDLIGGLHPERVIVVAARPGQGKSALVTGIVGSNGLRGIPALLFSPEMSRDEVSERMLSGDSGINGRALKSGAVAAQDWAKLYESGGRIGDLPVWVDDRADLTIGQLIGTALRWYSRVIGPVPTDAANVKPALIAIDYLQLVGADKEDRRRDEKRHEELTRMTRAIKQLAKKLKVPIIEVSQLNREVDKHQRPPVLADLRESGSIEQDADLVIFPWRELPADPHEAEREKRQGGPAQIRVEKNRHGATGVANVYWRPEITRFENPTEHQPHWQDR